MSNNNASFGTLLLTVLPDENVWKQITFNFIASQNAQYITVSNIPGISGWNQIDNFTITNSPLSISENEIQRTIITPNPMTSTATFSSKSNFENATIKVFDLSGRLVREVKNLNDSSYTFNRENLDSGLYLVSIKEDNRKIVMHKMIIND